MAPSRTLSVGMEVHQASIAGASVAQAYGAAVLSLGTVGTRPCASDTLSRPLQSTRTPRVFVYAAGPCGDWLARALPKQGHGGWVVAPALRPTKSGARGNTDRREALQWAPLMRAGDLPPVSVPAVHDDAMRDLSRARDETLHDRKTAKCRLQALRLRPDIRSTGRATWGPAHLRWLREVVWPTPAQHSVCQAEVRAVTAHPDRLQRRAQELHAQVPAWRLCPVVDAWHALRGVPLTVALTPVAALGDLSRCEHPRQLMHDLGLTPAAYASGARRRLHALVRPA